MWRILPFLFVLFFASVAVAQEDVQSLNESGLNAFSEGRYEVAAELFGRAYALQPRAELLKNRAVALYRADRCDEALPVASSFLEGEVTVPEREQILALKDGCFVVLAEKAIAAENFDLAGSWIGKANEQVALRNRVAAVNKAILDAEFLEATRAVALIPIEPEPIVSGAFESRRDNSVAWILIGFGAATLVGAGIYHGYEKFVTEDEFRRVASTASSRSRYEQLDNRLRVANWLMPALYTAGLITAGSGLTLYFMPTENQNSVAGIEWRTSF